MSQYARPDSDVVVSNWTTAPLWSKIDEVTADDADYIQTATTSTCELGLSNVSDPSSGANHLIKVRAQRTGAGATCTAYLFQGTTQICSFAVTVDAAWALTQYTLTAGEADSITDYSNLRFKFTGIRARIGWAELGVPDVSGNTYNESMTLAASGAVSPAHTLTINATMTLQASGSVGPESAGSVYNPVAALSALAALDLTTDAALSAAIVLQSTAAAITSGGMAYDSSVVMTAAAALAAAAALTVDGGIELAADAGITPSNAALLVAAASLLASAGVAQGAQAGVAATASLTAAAALTTQAQAVVEALLALSAVAGDGWAGDIEAAGIFYETLALAANVGLSAQAIATVEAITSLIATGGIATTSTALLEASLALLTIASFNTSGDTAGDQQLCDVLITILRRRRGR
jgi:hypothetical protein